MGRPEIAPARRVRLDLELTALGREDLHQFPRHVHVGRLVLVRAGDFHLPATHASRQQQCRGELRAFHDADAAISDFGFRIFDFTEDARGQLVVSALALHAVAQLAQRGEERGLRALVHPGHTAEAIHAVAEADHRREEARRRARVADEEFQRLRCRARTRETSTEAVHGDGAVAELGRVHLHVHGEAQHAEAVGHHLRVLAPQRAAQRGAPVGQCGEDESAIGDTLGAGHGDLRAHGRREWDNLDKWWQRHGSRKVLRDGGLVNSEEAPCRFSPDAHCGCAALDHPCSRPILTRHGHEAYFHRVGLAARIAPVRWCCA